MQVYPATHVVGPVQGLPPHWAHAAPTAVLVLLAEVDVLVVDVVSVVLELVVVPEPVPEPVVAVNVELIAPNCAGTGQ